jgi:ribosome-associated heat shock protein Hsp15
MNAQGPVRLDKWLWAVRLFRTRALAAAACEAGRVRINGQAAKPSRHVRPGESIVADNGAVLRTVKVIAVTAQRVGPPRVVEYLEETVPPKAQNPTPRSLAQPPFVRAKGSGRPTKKERRSFEDYFGH